MHKYYPDLFVTPEQLGDDWRLLEVQHLAPLFERTVDLGRLRNWSEAQVAKEFAKEVHILSVRDLGKLYGEDLLTSQQYRTATSTTVTAFLLLQSTDAKKACICSCSSAFVWFAAFRFGLAPRHVRVLHLPNHVMLIDGRNSPRSEVLETTVHFGDEEECARLVRWRPLDEVASFDVMKADDEFSLTRRLDLSRNHSLEADEGLHSFFEGFFNNLFPFFLRSSPSLQEAIVAYPEIWELYSSPRSFLASGSMWCSFIIKMFTAEASSLPELPRLLSRLLDLRLGNREFAHYNLRLEFWDRSFLEAVNELIKVMGCRRDLIDLLGRLAVGLSERVREGAVDYQLLLIREHSHDRIPATAELALAGIDLPQWREFLMRDQVELDRVMAQVEVTCKLPNGSLPRYVLDASSLDTGFALPVMSLASRQKWLSKFLDRVQTPERLSSFLLEEGGAGWDGSSDGGWFTRDFISRLPSGVPDFNKEFPDPEKRAALTSQTIVPLWVRTLFHWSPDASFRLQSWSWLKGVLDALDRKWSQTLWNTLLSVFPDIMKSLMAQNTDWTFELIQKGALDFSTIAQIFNIAYWPGLIRTAAGRLSSLSNEQTRRWISLLEQNENAAETLHWVMRQTEFPSLEFGSWIRRNSPSLASQLSRIEEETPPEEEKEEDDLSSFLLAAIKQTRANG